MRVRIPSILTTVGVWNGNIYYLAGPIPISPKFRCFPIQNEHAREELPPGDEPKVSMISHLL